MENIKNIAILGSTGSIGTQTLDIIENNPDKFKVTVLTANNNWELLVKQAIKFKPNKVIIANKEYYIPVKEALHNTEIQVESGSDSLALAGCDDYVDMVVAALVGFSGLLPTINAICKGKTIALANKETLVVAGELITSLAQKNNVKIIPVDSEHSAIFQCLKGEERKNMAKILLTASGGPFRTCSIQDLEKVTVDQALSHPNWNMGAKVTIDSATMMNKGFEMIEARWLFDCKPQNIEILIHPQSIVHSMVQYCDGSIKAQLGVPDMHIPIQYALSYPDRIPSDKYVLDWSKVHELTFEKPDFKKFPLLRIAFESIEKGGNSPCILNAANEIAVKAFLKRKIKFTRISELVESVLEEIEFNPDVTLSNLIEYDTNARKLAQIKVV